MICDVLTAQQHFHKLKGIKKMKKFVKFSALLLALMLVLAGCSAVKPVAPVSDEKATDQSWEYIKANGKIIVGLDDTFAPMGFRDEAGKIVGFDIDLANAVGKELGVEIELQPIEWAAKELELANKKIDVIWNGMSKNPERSASMTLSNPYLNNKMSIMTLKGSDVKKKDDLIGKKIAVQEGSSGLELLTKDAIYDKVSKDVTEYSDYDEAVMELETGRVDAVVIDMVLSGYKDSKKPDTYAIADEDFGDDLFVVGMRKEDKAFAQELQKVMDKLKADGTALELSEKWFSEDLIAK